MAKKNNPKDKPDNKGGYRSTERDQFTVVLEDIRSQFRVFGEGLSYVSDTLDKHTEILDDHTKQFKQIRSDITEVKERLTNVEIRLTNVETDVGEIKIRLTHVETELEFVKEQLSIIRHNQVKRDDFQLLETRVARLEHTRKQ